MHRIIFRSHYFKLVSLFALLPLVACQSGTGNKSSNFDNVVKIGMTAPLTGAAAESGISIRQGAELAVEEINANGGINIGGKMFSIALFVEDNESKPEVGVSAAVRLITKDKVHYLIGDAILSSVTMAIMDLAPRYEIPIVSCESVSTAIVEKIEANPEKYKYYWKMNFGSTAYADTIFNTINWLVDQGNFNPKTRTIFFIVEDTDYGRSNAQEAAKSFESIGWEVTAIETVPLGHTEFYPQLNKLKDINADVLISIFTPLSSGVALVKQFDEVGVSSLHLAIYYPTQPEFIQQAGDSTEGLLWGPLIFDPIHNDTHKDFAQRIRAKFNVEANLDHGYGFDAVNNAIDSIRRADSLEPNKIIEAIAKLDYRGIVGRYVFDPVTHQAISGPGYISIPAAQIQGGQNFVIWPEDSATGQYLSQPWLK